MKIFVGISLLLSVCIVAGMLGGLGWPFELFVSLLPQFAFAAFLLGSAGCFFLRQSRVALLLWAVTVVALWGAREQFFFADATVENPSLRIVWANMGNDRDHRSFVRLMQLARTEQADLVMASEFPVHLSKEEILQDSYGFPYVFGKPAGARTNIAVFSGLQIEEIGSVTDRWNSGFLVAVEDMKESLVIAGVHTPKPVMPANMRRRNEIVLGAAEALSDAVVSDGAAVLVGDFNAVSWSPLLRSLHEGKGSRISYGWRTSWRYSWPFLGLPIDQVVVFGKVRASVRIGKGIGSDHFPLVIDVELIEGRDTFSSALRTILTDRTWTISGQVNAYRQWS